MSYWGIGAQHRLVIPQNLWVKEAQERADCWKCTGNPARLFHPQSLQITNKSRVMSENYGVQRKITVTTNATFAQVYPTSADTTFTDNGVSSHVEMAAVRPMQ